ncbi:bifunctional nicotinamide-nucleotide adenylyltransferase/Nudix hydroxylase [Chitinivorax sp. B]|uniref:bifunctional nicotinamide-nucleotide adenylyltransferase/Nudix hydroxylase n=1 Tax=Chitinivorax sp. B TaxID=2502235 RepID=UPI0010F8DAA2|nr:bifunctional nicotinamide-nucleotide adenylyltransferase/Nudix hydroxylase [Chitinivorax sp. B]
MAQFDYLIFIGRFQPFHRGHLQTIRHALGQADKVIVIVGSARGARTFENPWTFQEREHLIRACLPPEDQTRVYIVGISDRMYNDQQWVGEVQSTVDKVIAVDTVNLSSRPAEYRIGMVSGGRSQDSYYLEFFPQWRQVQMPDLPGIISADIRYRYFDSHPTCQAAYDAEQMPPPVHDYLRQFRDTEHYQNLATEYAYIQDYKRSWARAPYPPTFVTVDAMVVYSGHILLVRRRTQPGKGLWALPGGFVDQNERIRDAAIRELREETKLKVPGPVLAGSIRSSRVFDHPKRSLRGRTITHAFLIELPPTQEGLPKVKGSDDADKAKWVPLFEFNRMEDQLFDDHFYIVNWFLGQI